MSIDRELLDRMAEERRVEVKQRLARLRKELEDACSQHLSISGQLLANEQKISDLDQQIESEFREYVSLCGIDETRLQSPSKRDFVFLGR